MSNQNKQVLLVGAYERENFGDLLFLLKTREYLANADVTAAAPFSGDMSEILGQNVPSYAESVSSKPFGAVWVVGGEVGGTTVADAYRMSANEDQYASFLELDARARISALEEVSGMAVAASPYLPRMSSFANTRGANLIVNSVGLSGIRRLVGARRDETWGAVREASFISVRDRQSSELLTKNSIDHLLAPDLVHSYRRTLKLSDERQSDVALVQVKSTVLKSYGTERFAEVLSKSAELNPFRIRLFSAGNARGHDSIELYQEVVDHMARIAPSRQIDISRSLMPIDKLREIAQCGLWIGTSLHGLIISSSFDVPRVALELEKLVRYATTWEETMPYGVSITDLNAAVDGALSARSASIASERSLHLAELADASARHAVKAAMEIQEQFSLIADRSRIDRAIIRRRSSLLNRGIGRLRPLG